MVTLKTCRFSRVITLLLVVFQILGRVNGDIYMHNPRGSNGRGARNSNGKDRSGNEAQRLFDSENNDAGGYSLPIAYPFPCYVHHGDEVARQTCNAKNTGLTEEQAKAQVRSDGTLVHPDAINTPKMYYYTGSILPIEWTAQHGAGENSKTHSDIIIQVACEDSSPGVYSFTDDCGDGTGLCQPRDGMPINNQDDTNTQRIAETPDSQDDYRYGRHESYRFYQRCKSTERNKGLFVADQNLNSNGAIATRQNANSARNGFECPEERDYYPYWNPSPWIDIAIVTSDMEKCNRDREESQNVKDKFFCECENCEGTGTRPISERKCTEKGGQWTAHPSWSKKDERITAPECVLGAFSRDNHLGNVDAHGFPFYYNWTIPDWLGGKNTCVLRVRYNISTSDFNDVSLFGDSRLNGDEASPLKDRNQNPEQVFRSIDNLCGNAGNCKLGLAVNTNQYGRTFQDRSHSFKVVAKPDEPDCDKIYNLNVRGKRGNIVQTYPAVEYDFVPNRLVATERDCIHVQWTGSDYNPNRDPNNGEGGPPNPNNLNDGKTDRSNMVQMHHERENMMLMDANQFSMFDAPTSTYKRLAFLDQPIESSTECLSIQTLRQIHNNDNDDADRDHRNCMKLSGAKTPYFDAGLLKPKEGIHKYMSTRNNNFSNRSQKGYLIISKGGLTGGEIAGIVIGTLAGVFFVAAAVMYFKKNNKKKTSPKPPVAPPQNPKSISSERNGVALKAPIAPPSHPVLTATAMYNHNSTEPGELSFNEGDVIQILEKDESGWYVGKCKGKQGIFPSNYVQEHSTNPLDEDEAAPLTMIQAV